MALFYLMMCTIEEFEGSGYQVCDFDNNENFVTIDIEASNKRFRLIILPKFNKSDWEPHDEAISDYDLYSKLEPLASKLGGTIVELNELTQEE